METYAEYRERQSLTNIPPHLRYGARPSYRQIQSRSNGTWMLYDGPKKEPSLISIHADAETAAIACTRRGRGKIGWLHTDMPLDEAINLWEQDCKAS